MNTRMIDGASYARMLSGGAAMLALHIKELNEMNVFPVADGDTGTNMLKTIEGGLSAAQKNPGDSIGDFSKSFSHGILLSARGNSGVILSQIFAGIGEVLEKYDSVDALTLAGAYRQGIKKSYQAVQNPTEGTILTVFRESTQYALDRINEDSTVEDFFRFHLEEARRSLASTPKILPALMEAGVVDSGGAGYVYIAEGMSKILDGEEIVYEFPKEKEDVGINIDRFTRDSVLTYGYCTEFLLRLTTAKVDPDNFDISEAISKLNQMKGESIVAYKQGDILKVHVHTMRPGEVLSQMQSFGEFLTVKIENMNLGHTEDKKEEPKPKKSFCVVAVAQGEGVSALFEQMGADFVVSGGQSQNPAIEDFIHAFDACGSKDIIVLPNNKNIILAAKQAAEIYKDSAVHVINTKNIAQGYSALSVITPAIKDIDSLITSAQRAAGEVIDGEITKAVRDAVVDGVDIEKG